MGLLDQRRWWLAAVLGASSVLAIMLSGERMALLTVGLDVVFLAVLFPRGGAGSWSPPSQSRRCSR